MLVALPDTKTKKHRSFTVNGEFFRIVKKYSELRPKDVNTNRFFMNYKHKKCTKQVIGKNKFAMMPRLIAEYLELPNPTEYTSHSFRRTSATLLADAGADITTLKRHGGWKSAQVAEEYIEDSINHKMRIENLIEESIHLEQQPKKAKMIPTETVTSHQTNNKNGTECIDVFQEEDIIKSTNILQMDETESTNILKESIKVEESINHSWPEKYVTINFSNCSNFQVQFEK